MKRSERTANSEVFCLFKCGLNLDLVLTPVIPPCEIYFKPHSTVAPAM